MKSPDKTLPSQKASASVSTGNEPTIKIDGTALFAASITDNAPNMSPPSATGETSLAEEAIGAAVWNRDKRVNGLYNTMHSRNSWMSIVGTGWVKLATTFDSANTAMSILAAQARTKNCRVDYSVDTNLVNEIYIF